jgi:predicted transposase YdaD
MSRTPFDATLKDLIEDDHLGWARLFNPRPVRSVAFVDADVSTLTAAADKVLRVEDDVGVRLLNVEPLGYHDAGAPGRLHLYSTVLGHRHGLPVRSILLLLRRAANATAFTGQLQVFEPGESEPYDTFRYQVIRLWDHPLAPLLTGGLGLLPLAPLTDEAAVDPGAVVRRIDERLRAEAPPDVADKMRTATFVLMGLRYDAAIAAQLFQEITTMEESTTYQLIISRGRLNEARRILLRQGRMKFGEPDAAVSATLEGIPDLDRLERMTDRILSATSWQDLLATP